MNESVLKTIISASAVVAVVGIFAFDLAHKRYCMVKVAKLAAERFENQTKEMKEEAE